MTTNIETAKELRARAYALAIAEGYTVRQNTSYYGLNPLALDALCAPRGRFEGEPATLPYFFERVMNGDGETLGSGETAAADILDVDDTERAAFGYASDVVAVAVQYSESGFLSLATLTADSLDALHAEFDTEEETDNG